MTIKNYYKVSYSNLSDLCNIREAIRFDDSEHYNFTRHASEVSREEFIASILREEDYIFVVETATNKLKELSISNENKKATYKFLEKHCYYKEEDKDKIFQQEKFNFLYDLNFYNDLELSQKDKNFLLTLSFDSIRGLEDIYIEELCSEKDKVNSLASLIKEARKWHFYYEDAIAEIPDYK